MSDGCVALVIGTRPEAIKLASVARALIERGLVPRLLLTGQHPSLDLEGFGFPDLPAAKLGCPGLADPRTHARLVAQSAVPHLEDAALVLVQGDTSSALGGALAASRAGVPVGHVEAGLRSHDSRNPWPEEEFRIGIDAIADLLFAPTELSAANLRREGVRGAIHVTGNTGVDATLARLDAMRATPRCNAIGPVLLVTCHRRESWGRGLANVAAAMARIASERLAHVRLVLHPNPAVASTMRRQLSGIGNIELVPPCGHERMLELMLGADLILSDSGGVQEEAPVLGKPLVVLRNRTERPEAIATGNMVLVGTDPQRIVDSVRRLLRYEAARWPMSRPSFPHGDGRSSERIAGIVEQFLRASDVRPTGQSAAPWANSRSLSKAV